MYVVLLTNALSVKFKQFAWVIITTLKFVFTVYLNYCWFTSIAGRAMLRASLPDRRPVGNTAETPLPLSSHGARRPAGGCSSPANLSAGAASLSGEHIFLNARPDSSPRSEPFALFC